MAVSGISFQNCTTALSLKGNNYHNIFSSTFFNNSIGISTEGGSITTISNCFFSNHSRSVITSTISTLSISSSQFFLNSGAREGGCIFATSTILNVVNSSFTNNTAISAAVYLNFNSSAVFNNVEFSKNFAQWSAAVYVSSALKIIFHSCTFSYNECVYGGAGVGTVGNIRGIIEFTSCNFIGNIANFGGGMYIGPFNLTITNCYFSLNNGSYGSGISLFLNSFATISNSFFRDNTVRISLGFGSCIYASDNSVIRVYNTEFSGNSAYSGGVIFYNTIGNYSRIQNCTFLNNRGENVGTTLYLSVGRHFQLINNTFYNSSGISRSNIILVSGTVYIDSSTIFAENNTFYHNSAANAPGFLFYYSDVVISHLSCYSNSANQSGGCLSFHWTKAQIISSSFSGNSARYGGAMLITNNNTISITNSYITKNHAVVEGGGIYIFASLLRATGTNFISNSANSGGGIFLDQSSIFILFYFKLHFSSMTYNSRLFCLPLGLVHPELQCISLIYSFIYFMLRF